MLLTRAMMMVFAMTLGLAVSTGVFAQDSVDDLLEKARAEAAEIEKLKKILNEEPDQNVRLAAFGLMIKDSNSTMHEIAVEAGLASADKLLQAAAFKEAIGFALLADRTIRGLPGNHPGATGASDPVVLGKISL
jgi:hypothetical protein